MTEAMVFLCWVSVSTGEEVCGTEPVPRSQAESYRETARMPGWWLYLKEAKNDK